MAKKENRLNSNFSKITIMLASPDSVLDRSHGEIKKPETINYRTYKPEMEGLFCERVFGPTKDYECYCGKYKRIRYKGIVCDRCGVEVTEKKVRRERMGHINLTVPIVHIWYFKSLPNKIGYLLGMGSKKLESVIYYERYVVIQPGNTSNGVMLQTEKGEEERQLAYLDLLTEEEYLSVFDNESMKNNYQLEDTDPNKFVAKMGAEAVKELLGRINLDELSYQLRHAAANETSRQRKSEALKRLSVVEAFREANEHIENRPEWMVVQHLPVIPPELRPLVPLDGGRFASSDLNDLYRRVIIRNNRLKRLHEIKAPEVILRNEKRMLQEAVDSLFDNSRKSNAVKAEGGRQLKSLSDVLKGKQGRFRQNLLGKRVDYSGRSVIVVGPELKLHECGLPKDMAAELFKPFIIRKLTERGIVKTVKSAKKLVDKKEPIIWDILENVLKGHPILLNRAPTLHRLSIQAFLPKLIEGKAIQLHPLVCSAFNADFDGDQMAVHVPLGNAAVLEAQMLMLASHNILNPQNGTPITLPSQDMVLGLYYMTKSKLSTETEKVKGEGLTFYGAEEAVIAFNEKKVELNAVVKCRVRVVENNEAKYKVLETTLGRIILNQVVPEKIGYVNKLLGKKELKNVIGNILAKTDIPTTAKFLDDIKRLGFFFSFKGGLSFNISDVLVPNEKEKLVAQAQEKVDEITDSYQMGLITDKERFNQVVDIWTHADNQLTIKLMNQITKDRQGFNSIFMMLDSGARGSKQQIKQLSGMRGLMAKPRKAGTTGAEVIENPVLANFKEGLSVLEYFISTHGARKGLSDTALKTADAGYLTRRLVDVAQDVVITEEDCGTLRGIAVSAIKNGDEIVESLSDRILGRSSLVDIFHPETDELLVAAGTHINEVEAKLVESSGLETVEVRSVLTCEARKGACVKCYGRNLATNRVAEEGDSVGIIAAQSIGEPGTQLTLRTFHVGGIASLGTSESKLRANFDGVLQLDGVRVIAATDENGEKQTIVIGRTGELRIVKPESDKILQVAHVPYGSIISFKDGQKVGKGDEICRWDPYNNVIVSEVNGKIRFENIIANVTYRDEMDEQTGHHEKVITETKDKTKAPTIVVESGKDWKNYSLPVGAHLSIENGETVKPGQILAKIPRVTGKVKDITGGLPRVTELFEARNPSNPASVAEIDGVVRFGGIKRGNREVIIESKDGEIVKYLVPLSKQILVQEQDFVRAGTPVSDGAITPTDILNIKGPFAVQEYLVNEIQDVYRLQGIKINDKHIEVIVRQMMNKMIIEDAGDTKFLEGEQVEKFNLLDANDQLFDKKVVTEAGDSETLNQGQIVTLRKVREENSLLKRNDKKLVEFRDAIPATATPKLQGITRASLSTASWISAASFQETTKVLSTSSIAARQDYLEGLKENVIVGHRIPAGTGLRKFSKIFVASKEDMERVEKQTQDVQESGVELIG
ncbi:MAG: DNA-directed RNA polymerase subunit beta' [Chitinophagales bacterium]|nr:DNA-directed RNA polymerase subunit beta' [Chitinophagales bacterium]MCO5280775.1 DNA-directed RNA polymerase subunit beta' [Chitinophagales bacterium]